MFQCGEANRRVGELRYLYCGKLPRTSRKTAKPPRTPRGEGEGGRPGIPPIPRLSWRPRRLGGSLPRPTSRSRAMEPRPDFVMRCEAMGLTSPWPSTRPRACGGSMPRNDVEGKRKPTRSISRPERHFVDSFTTLRLARAYALIAWLPRCPLCHRRGAPYSPQGTTTFLRRSAQLRAGSCR